MSVLVVGLSHASAPVAVLERAAAPGDELVKLLHDSYSCDAVAGAFVLSTCNRVEVYAEVDKFHAGVAAICDLLARHSGVPEDELTSYLYVHYADRAMQHLLSVACGLESMAIGEPQILGQVRGAVRLASEHGTLGGELSRAGALAMRAGKRAHAETGIGSVAPSLVSRGLDLAAARLPAGSLAGARVLVVGAGAASALAVTAVTRIGAGQVVIANRTPGRATRLARAHGAAMAGLSQLADLMAAADLVVSCTGAIRPVVSRADTAAAARQRPPGRPLVLLDLALPRDIEPAAAQVAGVHLIDLAAIAGAGRLAGHEQAVAAVRQIAAQELASYVGADRAAAAAPVVVALRARADAVVAAELARLTSRLGRLDEHARREISRSMSRIAGKLLHVPTVRVKELAGAPVADSYEAALRVLFDLDPAAVQAVALADSDAPPRTRGEVP